MDIMPDSGFPSRKEIHDSSCIDRSSPLLLGAFSRTLVCNNGIPPAVLEKNFSMIFMEVGFDDAGTACKMGETPPMR